MRLWVQTAQWAPPAPDSRVPQTKASCCVRRLQRHRRGSEANRVNSQAGRQAGTGLQPQLRRELQG